MITKKTEAEIKILREGGIKLAKILDQVVKLVKPGANTADLEELACRLIEEVGGRPSFKHYEVSPGDYYPTALCASINSEIVHAPAIPGRILQEGDIIGLDIGMEYPLRPASGELVNKYSSLGGFYTDMARTIAVGKIDKQTKKLIDVTRRSLELAIGKVKPGNTLRDIGKVVQDCAESNGFSVVRDLVGHGVGHTVHEDPQVFNYDFTREGIRDTVLEEGMVIAIEPMVNAGTFRTKTAKDGFSIITADGALSAHFEHSVAVVPGGHLIITK